MKLILTFWVIFLFTNLSSLSSNPRYVTPSDNYHIVKKNDTLESIGKENGISVTKLKLYNNLTDRKIILGQKIYLEPKREFKSEFVTVRNIPKTGFHIVKRGESLFRISKMYDVYVFDLVDYNDLTNLEIKKGQKIWLIKRKTSAQPQKVEKYESGSSKGVSVKQDKKVKASPKIDKSEKRDRKKAKKDTRELFLPVDGIVTSEFGMRHGRPHKGIDIAAPEGTPIYAALAGKVVYSGVQRGYGNVIIIDHGNDVMTVYAHNKTNFVRVKDTVKRGQPIGKIGKTGHATGPHLHFEYRLKGKARNPRKYLKGLK